MGTNYCKILITLSALLAGCLARRPAYVVVPRAASRSEEPAALPLDPAGRARLEAFLSRAGHPRAPDPAPDVRALEHARALDALTRAETLPVTLASPTSRRFCEAAVALCRETALFRGQPLVRQVVDARESRRPVPAPLAVRDGGYWWIFRLRGGRLAEVLLIVDVNRDPERQP